MDAPAITPPYEVLPDGAVCGVNDPVAAGALHQGEGAAIVRSAEALVPCRPGHGDPTATIDLANHDVVVFTHRDPPGGPELGSLVALTEEGDLLTAVFNERSYCGAAPPGQGIGYLVVLVPRGRIARAHTIMCPDAPCPPWDPKRGPPPA